MHPRAGDARQRLIGVIIVVLHLIRGPSLHGLARVRTAIEKRAGHRMRIAFLARFPPRWTIEDSGSCDLTGSLRWRSAITRQVFDDP